MFWIIGILTAILLVVVFVAMYLAMSFVDTSSSIIRVVTTFGEATHIMKPGPGFVFRGIQQYYDYGKHKFVIDLLAENIFTNKGKDSETGKMIDEMPLDIDSTVIFSFSDNEHDMLEVFNEGLAPGSGNCLQSNDTESKKIVTNFILKFVHAIQSDVVGRHTWKDVVFKKGEFASTVLASLKNIDRHSGTINPFKVLHVNENLTYVINRVILPPTLRDALPAKAIADQVGEGIIAEATHKRDADKLALVLIEEHSDAAKIDVMQTFAKNGKSTIFIPTNIADGLGQIAKSIGD